MGAGGPQLVAAKAWKLFIGQLSYNFSEPDLFPFFSQFGNILELVLLRTPDGRSKGCGFLIYSSQEEAENAIAQGNGQVLPNDVKARPLMVRYANVKQGAGQ
jgi:RNA recognition motif-containing protein